MNSVAGDWELPQPSFLIQKSPDQRLFASFPELIAGYHVFRRLSMPRHPPYTLSSLTTFIDHRHKNCQPSLPTCVSHKNCQPKSLSDCHRQGSLQTNLTAAGGRAGRSCSNRRNTINNGSIRRVLRTRPTYFAKKVLDDTYPSEPNHRRKNLVAGSHLSNQWVGIAEFKLT